MPAWLIVLKFIKYDTKPLFLNLLDNVPAQLWLMVKLFRIFYGLKNNIFYSNNVAILNIYFGILTHISWQACYNLKTVLGGLRSCYTL